METHIKQVIKRTGTVVPFNQDRITNAIYRAAVAVGGRDKEKAKELSNKVIELMNYSYKETSTLHIEEIQDLVEKVLIENGHAKVAKEYILYRDERKRAREAEARYASKINDNIPWQKIWRNLDWAVSHKLHTIENLNQRIENGEFPQIVHESESLYEDDVELAANLIIERLDSLRMVMISGPSSSGKTTTTLKLEEKLTKKGFKFKALIVDHYFFDLELHPKDEFGDYDFETPHALDLELINEHLIKLSKGEEVLIPYYDFKTGKRTLDATPLKLQKDEILLIDSLHGLYPAFSKDIPSSVKFKLYLEPLLQVKGIDGKYVRWTDIRLIRRMLRDSVFRAYNPQQTLEHWHYVRSSELRNIIPYSSSADFIVSSAMPYELPIYANRMLNLFKQWEAQYKDNLLKNDSYQRAKRVFNLLKTVTPYSDESSIPSNSVIREFIGGSSMNYH
jgi:uridine kinase